MSRKRLRPSSLKAKGKAPVSSSYISSGPVHSSDYYDEEGDTLDEEQVLLQPDSDASAERINDLRGFLKSLLFREEVFSTEQALADLRPDLTSVEKKVCLQLVTNLKPYIPSKVNYRYIGHQIPFVILANDLLRCAGYAKFCRKICPMPSSGLKSFRLDTASLFKTFCEHGDNKLSFFGYDNQVLKDPLYINHKDAVFNSFFKIDRILDICKRRNLVFAHHFHLLPGGKYVRLLGIKNKTPMKTTKDTKINNASKSKTDESTWVEIVAQREKQNDVLKQEINELQRIINDLSKRLKPAYKNFNDQAYGLKIKAAKESWKDPLNLKAAPEGDETGGLFDTIFAIVTAARKRTSGTHDEGQKLLLTYAKEGIKLFIDQLKAERCQRYPEIQKIKSDLAHNKQQKYIRTRAMNLTKKDIKASP